MKVLKLFLEDYDPKVGLVSYSVEDENGDRVARGQHKSSDLSNFNPTTMDFFVVGFLPQLRRLGLALEVQGPISASLSNLLQDDNVKAIDIVEETGQEYNQKDLDFIAHVFLETLDLNKTLSGVFNYFK